MHNLYLIPNSLFMIISLLQILAIAAQGYLLVRSIRFQVDRIVRNMLEPIFEGLLLLHLLLLGYRLSAAKMNLELGLYREPDSHLWAILLLAAMLALIAADLIVHRRTFFMMPMLLAGAALVGTQLPGAQWGASAYFLDLCGMIGWSVIQSARLRRLRAVSLSVDSIREAVNQLPSGILFCESDGCVVLINRTMMRLMTALTGRFWVNAVRFRTHLLSGRLEPGCAKVGLPDESVFSLPDGRLWLFKMERISRGHQSYIQYTAFDVSEEWRLVEQQKAQQEDLDRHSQALKRAIENIQSDVLIESRIQMQNHFHNVLGQRIAWLLRALQDQTELDEQLLRTFEKDLPNAIWEAELERPECRLERLVCTMEQMGVDLSLSGALPSDDPAAADLFVEVLTEGVTNAVRHALADRIEACFGADGRSLQIRNGGNCPQTVQEGGGIGAIRQKVTAMGGCLAIETGSVFIIKATLPPKPEAERSPDL